MTELERLKLVYAELRKHLGQEVPARRILEYCTALIDFIRETNEDFHVDPESHQRIFTNWAVDVAMAEDGGWRVVGHELGSCSGLWVDEEQVAYTTQAYDEIRKFQMSSIRLGETRHQSVELNGATSPKLINPRSELNSENPSEEDL